MKASPSPKTNHPVGRARRPYAARLAHGGVASGGVAQFARFVVMVAPWGGCSVYAESFLDVARSQTFAVRADAVAATAPPGPAGGAAVRFAGGAAAAGAAGEPPAVIHSNTLCGDGRIEAGELCDIAIPAGMP